VWQCRTRVSRPAVGLKIKGQDIAMLEALGQELETVLRTVAGTQSVIAERISSGYFIDTRLDPVRLARFGIGAEDALLTTRYAISGDNAVVLKDHNNNLIRSASSTPQNTLIPWRKFAKPRWWWRDSGALRLGEIAEVAVSKMPEMLRSENGVLTSYVYVDIGNASATDYVDQTQRLLAEK
jgi:Cu(I)/Ag(I) efflux system membrane protein CusA/SilA